MNVSFSGSRPPRGGYTLGEVELMRGQVADLPRGTRIATGGSKGFDEEIMEAARGRGLYVVTLLPGERWREDTSEQVWRLSHEVRNTGKDPMSRNYDVVEFGERLRAAPLYESERMPRSGTWGAIHIAQRMGCLERVLIMRPKGLPGPVMQEPRGDHLVTIEHLAVT